MYVRSAALLREALAGIIQKTLRPVSSAQCLLYSRTLYGLYVRRVTLERSRWLILCASGMYMSVYFVLANEHSTCAHTTQRHRHPQSDHNQGGHKRRVFSLQGPGFTPTQSHMQMHVLARNSCTHVHSRARARTHARTHRKRRARDAR